MTILLEEAPALLISLVLLIAITVLMALGTLPIDNPLTTAIFVGVMSYWIGNGSARTSARQINAALTRPSSTNTAEEKEQHTP